MASVTQIGVAIGLTVLSTFAQADAPVVSHFSYDLGDNVSQVTDPRGLVTTYVTDGIGQRWQQVSPDTGTTTYSYDSYGRVASMTRADGVQTTYGYDGIGRRTSVSAGGQTHTFAYDSCTNGVGRLCSAGDATGTTSYSYTPEGRLAGRGFSVAGTSYGVGFSYNATGQLTTLVYPDGNQADYTYTNGAVSAVQVNINGALYNAATGVAYQPGDVAMASWISSNGLSNSMSYDTDGRTTSINVPGIQSLSLAYDSADRLSQISNGIDSAMTQNVGYDAMSRLAWVVAGADNESLQYDANGNRSYQVLNGTAATVSTSSSSNRTASLSGGANTTYGYDANGNIITVSGVSTFAYDPFNRMSASANGSYYVNAEGLRLRKSSSVGTTYFAPDPFGILISEFQPGSIWVDYIWLNGRLIGRIAGGQLQAIHADQVGRPEAVTDSSQTIVWRARNFAFDRSVTVSNSVPLNLGFPGQYYDTESGLWNNGARDYSAALGRYIESDPIGLAGGMNTYAYAGGNPLIYTDPTGLRPGDPFSSPSAAAIDALRSTWLPTSVNSAEYAGLIYSSGGSYYATTPVPGSYDRSSTFNSVAESEVRAAQGTPVGEFHTHPYVHMDGGMWMKGNRLNTSFNSDCFSQEDLKLARKAAGVFKPFTSYLGTPSSMQSYTPSTGSFTSIPYNW
jgi:RHS repeat-associated protein